MKYSGFYYLWLIVALFVCYSCSSDSENEGPDNGGKGAVVEAMQTAKQLWNTSPFHEGDISRQSALSTIQRYADNCDATYFKHYLSGTDAVCENAEKYDLVLAYYRAAFDRVLEGIKQTQVANGTTEIWMLYNMGYIIHTPSGRIGIDISHRWAKKLAPYLDALCITHNHSDHYSDELIQAMFDLGKPVLSNYLKIDQNYVYTSKVATNYTIGNFNIRTSITDHNNSGLANFVTVFQIDCGEDSGNFVLLHVGDSNYKTSQYTNIDNKVSLLIPRYAPNALTENNIIGTGTGQVMPDYVLLSHILELAHAGVEESRWSIELALSRAAKINCTNTGVPMWGEKLVWKDGMLN